VETSAGEVRIGETERRRSKRGSGEKKRGEGREEEIEERENSGSKESGGGVGNMGRGGRSGKVRGRSKETGTGKVSPVDKGVWEEAVGENAHKEIVGPRNRSKRGICAEERESISLVEGRKGRSKRVRKGTAEERIHSAIQIAANGTSVLCRKEGWEEEDGAGLSLS